ncbi:BamA/TamA family outer membrane protein [Roseibium salinum]|nr:BamA/TamA family outer membrane protein [Roseibium salinum]
MTGLGETIDPQELTYHVGATFTRPGFLTRDTSFVASLAGDREVLDVYTRTGISGAIGLRHIFGDDLSGRIFLEASQGHFEDDAFGERDFTTLGLAGALTYDGRDSETNATEGLYLEGAVEPFYEFVQGNTALKLTAEGRAYAGLGAEDRVVLAGRLKVGSISGPSIADLPPDKLYLAGGGGSVRGYGYRTIGVETFGVTTGGRSLIEGSAELRVRATDKFGVVGFIDAAQVGAEPWPEVGDDLRVGAGAGIRYDTGFGPIRLDVGVPLDKRTGDPDFAVYVGIGQAFLTRILIALAFLNLGFPATAQETPEEERSRFLSFVENRLSTPNRSIRIRNIQGVLSSEATIGEITIADHEGVWLRIQGVTIDWNRSALILRQRLDVERLAAETIEMLRMPLPDPGLPAPEAGTFTVPELPISIDLGQLEVERLSFEDNVFGLAATVSLEGSLRLEDGTLDAALEVVRLDGPGGQLTLEANYANETQALDINLAVSEPANGMIVNLLDIPGNPPLSLTAAGSGPIDNFDLDISLQAAGEPAADGQVQLRGRDDGLAFTADLSGSIEQLIQEPYRAFFGAQTSLSASGVALNSGAFLLDNLTLASAALQLQAAAETGVDGFLQSLDLDATIGEAGESKVILPVPGGDVSVRSTRLGVVFGKAAGGMWTATLDVVDLATGTFSAQNLSLEAGGEAQNLSQPQQRRITFRADGAMTGISAERPELADALGDRIAIALEGGWQAGAPVMLDSATLSAEAFSLLLAGRIVDYAFLGDIALQAGSIAPFSGLAGRELSGSADLEASGEVRPLTGAFDLRLDGQASDVEVGVAALDSLLAGTTRTTGRIARGPDGIAAENLRIANERVEITADGSFASDAADITFGVDLQDLALITDRATGRLTASGRALGAGGLIDLKFDASVPNGALAGKELGDGQLTFEGTLQDGDLNGDVTGAGGRRRDTGRSGSEGRARRGRAKLEGNRGHGRAGAADRRGRTGPRRIA